MAQTFVRQIIDDFDGEAIRDDQAERIYFSFDGADYAIDLRPGNAERLRGDLDKWIKAAVKVDRGGNADRLPHKRTRRDFREIREWASRSGLSVSNRGRIPRQVLEAFDDAHDGATRF